MRPSGPRGYKDRNASGNCVRPAPAVEDS